MTGMLPIGKLSVLATGKLHLTFALRLFPKGVSTHIIIVSEAREL